MPNGQNHSKRSHDELQTDRNQGPAQVPIQQKDEDLTYYPAYCHRSSPTWFEWVKLTAHDIHTRLHIQDGYQHSWLTEHRFTRDVPQLVFYLNHPIQFVQVVGVVVSFDEYFDRFWLFTIDDSSGLTIDVVCRKPIKEKAEADRPGGSINLEKSEEEKEEEKEIIELSNLVTSTVELGAVLQVKGVITLFRRNRVSAGSSNDLRSNGQPSRVSKEEPTRQISLQRLSKVHDTNHEIGLIAARTKFYKLVLAQPWILSEREQKKLHKEALGEIEHGKKRSQKAALKRQRLIEVEKEDAETIQQEYAREEGERKRHAEVAGEAGKRLKEGLEQEGIQLANQIVPKPDRRSGNMGSGGRRDYEKKRRSKREQEAGRGGSFGRVSTPDQHDATNDSFGPLEDEKSALLRLAFG